VWRGSFRDGGAGAIIELRATPRAPQHYSPAALSLRHVRKRRNYRTSNIAPNVSSVHEHWESPLAYSVLYSFEVPPDGRHPAAGLIDVRGTLYGTTPNGGAYGDGTVFSITTGGTQKVLHSFKGTNGRYPVGGLINVERRPLSAAKS
jgi:uncharacterized repeat protein (TIGR03803 family)